MSWALLLVLFAAVLCLPMVPAILEWAKPSDAEPLHIDRHDALDPSYLADAFVGKLAESIAERRRTVGPYQLALAPATAMPWPLTARETRKGVTRRAWHSKGPLVTPPGLRMLATAAAGGSLTTASGGTYHSLWSGELLTLAPGVRITRWAHGRQVTILDRCDLAGRITAEESIMVTGDCSFTLLHAPSVQFGTPRSGETPQKPPIDPALPLALQPSTSASRAMVLEPLTVSAGSRLYTDVVCHDHMRVGDACEAHGSIKAHGTLMLGTHCRVHGNLVAGKELTLGKGCTVTGSILAEGTIVLGPGCTVGAPGSPATVAAPRIEVGQGTIVFGTVWAGAEGVVYIEAADAADAADIDLDGSRPATLSQIEPGVEAA